jgi:hypothetical protein
MIIERRLSLPGYLNQLFIESPLYLIRSSCFRRGALSLSVPITAALALCATFFSGSHLALLFFLLTVQLSGMLLDGPTHEQSSAPRCGALSLLQKQKLYRGM